MAEIKYYPRVQGFIRRNLDCFETDQNVGIGIDRVAGNIDVVGLRHVGGDLRGDVELIAVEVKDNEPFLKSVGQALAYGVIADRCYLASDITFNRHQRDVASHLGVGLISIVTGSSRPGCREVQSADLQKPIRLMRDELIEGLGYAFCVICGSPFRIRRAKEHAKDRVRTMTSEYVTRATNTSGIDKAREKATGYVFWIDDLEEKRRDVRAKTRGITRGTTYDRRYICSTCTREFGYVSEA